MKSSEQSLKVVSWLSMKIRIFGSIASGKSALANFLGKKLSIPVYCTDDIVYTRPFIDRRNEKERIAIINKTLKKGWIVEGVHYASWCRKTYDGADLIIVMDRSIFLLSYRIITRCLFKEKSHYKNVFSNIYDLLKMLFRDHYNDMKGYKRIASKKPYYILKNNDYKSVLRWIKSIP